MRTILQQDVIPQDANPLPGECMRLLEIDRLGPSDSTGTKHPTVVLRIREQSDPDDEDFNEDLAEIEVPLLTLQRILSAHPGGSGE